MTSRFQQRKQFNTAGLEADVMRFMAIIAFCLIAMTAMVKDDHSPRLIPKATKKPDQADRLNAVSVKPPRPVQIAPALQGTASQQVAITKVTALPSTVTQNQDTLENPESINKTHLSASQSSDETDTLMLRFDTDKAFIQLIASGKLALFAQQEDGYLAMDHDFHISKTNPSGDLYEVMDTSIPSRIKHIFDSTGSTTMYLVRLPEKSRSALREFFRDDDTPVTGTLVIRQDGSIIHES